MTTEPALTTSGPRRWHEQRWLVDETIRASGIEFDQPRLGYTLGPVGGDSVGSDMVLLRTRVRKMADFVPAVSSVAARREALARAAEDAGRTVTAGEHWFAAALLWSMACWPLWETTPQLRALDDKKTAAYLAWTRHASHRVERVDVPFGDASLPAWLHLPVEPSSGPFPVVLACGGMDAPREVLVAREGDGYLARGIAVLAFDGPGQGEAPIHGVFTSPEAWDHTGEALLNWVHGRDDLDSSRVAVSGTSFGSHWVTRIAASQPTLLGCAAALPVFEPGVRTIFEDASPTFKGRHMWMAGLERDEAAFDRLAAGYDLRPLMEKMTVPWLIIGGDADELSPTEWVNELAGSAPAPSELLIYQGARHSLTESMAPILGPPWRSELMDWLADRLNGVPATSSYRSVNAAGIAEHRQHPAPGR
jgi:alpha-beta hydrolase superfamily lysophospholipase